LSRFAVAASDQGVVSLPAMKAVITAIHWAGVLGPLVGTWLLLCLSIVCALVAYLLYQAGRLLCHLCTAVSTRSAAVVLCCRDAELDGWWRKRHGAR
jgi:hypothetical protein